MRAGANLQTPVPSKNLLRFLRRQSEKVCFTTSNSKTGALRYHPASNASPSHSSRQQLSTSTQRPAPVKSSYLDDLYPHYREQPPKALPAPRAYLHNHPPQTRHASTGSTQRGFFRRLLSFRDRQDQSENFEPHHDNSYSAGQYEDPSTQLFNLSRALSRNPAGVDLKLRCTEFDANGSVTLVSGEFKKSELIAKYGLLPRDLRKIDSSVIPHILVRPSAILINLLHLRVLIQSDRVLVFDAFGSTDSYTQSVFMYDLEGKLRQKADPRASNTHLPYELRALEAVLISATTGLETEFSLVRDPVVRVLRALESDIDREKLRHLLIHSKKLGTFEQKARLVRDAINDLLEADDDLAAMYLTERKQVGKPREENDHQEVEMLLESYHKICDEIVEISGNLISNIRNTEEIVRAILDSNRNQLMLLEIKFSIGTLGLAGGTLIAGLYGMNLENFVEESEFAFGGVTGICLALSAIVCIYGMRKLRKVQKVSMWGEGPNTWSGLGLGRGNWRNEAIESAAMQGEKAERIRKLRAAASQGAGGPVLWPGMEGLGMHKLEGDRGQCRVGEDGPTVTIRDDIKEKEEGERLRRMKEEKMLVKTAKVKGT